VSVLLRTEIVIYSTIWSFSLPYKIKLCTNWGYI